VPDRTRTARWTVASDPGRFREVRDHVRRFAAEVGEDSRWSRQLVLALHEAVTNAHRHAYAGRDDGRIDIDVTAGSDAIVVHVRDYGRTFDRAKYRGPDPASPSEDGGYGIHLMSATSDHVAFRDVEVGTEVVIIKSRSRAARAADDPGDREERPMHPRPTPLGDRTPADGSADPAGVRAELEELCRLHDVGVDLIRRSDDVDQLMGAVLDELERRLEEIPRESLGNTLERDPSGGEDPRVRNLVRFATQAVALKARAEATEMLRRHARELEGANERLNESLRETDQAVRRLDGVLEALDSGIVILGRDGTVRKANRAAAALTGCADLEGVPSHRLTGDVPPGGDGEVRWNRDGDGSPRVLLVSRRTVCADSGDEVVLLHDVTERDRMVAERHRNDKMAELLRAVGVLAHKINNPLTALLGRAQILQMSRADDERTCKAAAVIEESGRRIADLIRELATVVKTGDVEYLERVLRMDEAGSRPQGGTR